jgi:hypothetical protein
VHDDESNNIIRQIITQNPATLFVIFMSLANITPPPGNMTHSACADPQRS